MNFFKKLPRPVGGRCRRAAGCRPRKLSGQLSRCRHAKRGLSGTPPKPLNSKPLNDSTDKQLSRPSGGCHVVAAAERQVVGPCGRCRGWGLGVTENQ